MPTKTKKVATNLVEKFFYFHGLELTDIGGQLVGDCPFCDGTHKFHADDESAQWDCKLCGESGNAVTFMEKLLEEGLGHTDYEDLSPTIRTHRKKKASWSKQTLPSDIQFARMLERADWCKHPFREDQLVVPIFAPYKKCVDDPDEAFSYYVANLRIYDYGKSAPRFCSTPKIKKTDSRQHPWVNAAFLSNPHPHAIWITEGEWDGLLLDYALNGAEKKDDPSKHKYWVLATAGGSISLNLTALRRAGLKSSGGGVPIVCIGDNDKAGRRTAKDLADSFAYEFDAKVSCYSWPEETPEGYDLTEALANPESPFREGIPAEDENGNKIGPGMRIQVAMQTLINQSADLDLTNEGSAEPDPDLEPATYEDVVNGFRELGVKINRTIRELLWLAGACVVSSQKAGVPLWLFAIAPPGGGKSLVLSSFGKVGCTYYQTSLSKKGLVSGFNAGGGDPSLLAQITEPPKTLVVQDWTTVMEQPQTFRAELSSLLREAFDGSIDQKFANGPHRKYKGQFGIVAGVTPKIHSIQEADVGARFLKREWLESLDNTKKLLHQALTSTDGSLESAENVAARRLLVKRWLEPIAHGTASGVNDEILKEPEADEIETLIALAYWVAVGRAVVTRDRLDGAPLYRPSTEAPTRTVKQLGRMYQYLSLVRPTAERKDVLGLVAGIAWDTSWSRKADCLINLAQEPRRTPRAVAAQLGLPKTTTERAFHDLRELSVITPIKLKREARAGRMDVCYEVAEWFRPYADICLEYFG